MEADTERTRPLPSSLTSERRRKPLSDISNFVIPISSVLRKLSSSLSTPPRNPIHKSKPNPNPNSKPYCSSKTKSGTNPSKSDTSIGSSNYNHNDAPLPKTPPHASVTNSGNGSEEVCEPLVVYSRRDTVKKTKKKGKAVDVPCTYCSLQKTKHNENFSSPLLQKTKDKGKGVAVPFNCSLVNKRRDNGKATAVSISHLGKTKDNGKAVSVPIAFPSLLNTRSKRKLIELPFSCPPLPRTKKIRTEFNEVGDVGPSKSCTVPPPKNKKKRHCLLQGQEPQDVPKSDLPQEFIELQRAYFKDIDEFELPEEEISESELDTEGEKKCYNHDEVGAP